ncbi:hypothetical protein [Xenophilus azovorans]|uniref:hypothetical protein n=1 Tax=Xenophilus azovorans TaxID=151755 RepID=UPI00057175BD|nr:hypothetical protein [Xenophilus azovorans]
MPLLAQLFMGLFGSLLGGLAKDATRKAVTLAATITSFGVAAATLMLAFQSIVSPMLSAMFSTGYGQALGLAFPPVAGDCLASYVLCWLACAAYRAHLRITEATASA